MGGDEEAWLTLGRVAQIMDNLIAARKAHPMIVVMPNGNVAQEAAPGESALGLVPPTPYLPKTMEGTFESTFPDIVQYVDTHYRTSRKKSHRAICGLSMGGSMPNLYRHDTPTCSIISVVFRAVAPGEKVHSEVYENMELKLKKQFDTSPELYWISIGKDDFLYSANLDYRKYLSLNNYPYTWFETEGGHSWRNWRHYISRFVQEVFK